LLTDEPLAIDGILLFQPLQVDALDGVPAEACQICNFLIGKAIGKQALV
jgi:hypothetical protein